MLQHLNTSAGVFLLFLIYSTLGWCGEMIYCSIGQRKLCEKRGFLNGTLCPIYGFGALLVLWALRGGCENPILTFLLGAILTSAVEYFTSWLMEKLFHMRWWDYSRRRFQIRGRVCLLNSTLFGLLCAVLCHLLPPEVMKLIQWLTDHHIVIPLAAALFVLFAADVVLSVRSAIQIGNRLEKLQALQDELQAKLEELLAQQRERTETWKAEQQAKVDAWKAQQQQAADELREKLTADLAARRAQTEQRLREGRDVLEELGGEYRQRWEAFKSESEQRMKSLLHGQDVFERRLLDSYPTLRSDRHAEALEKLRQALEESKARRRQKKEKKS